MKMNEQIERALKEVVRKQMGLRPTIDLIDLDPGTDYADAIEGVQETDLVIMCAGRPYGVIREGEILHIYAFDTVVVPGETDFDALRAEFDSNEKAIEEGRGDETSLLVRNEEIAATIAKEERP
jgi:hypothetical protein